MSPENISSLLFSLIFLITMYPSSSQSDQQHTILLKIKTGLGRAKVFTNWNTNNPVCNFTGIVCSGENFVKEIDLSQQKLVGALDFDSICSSSLGSSLEKLSLGSNLLHGTITSHVSNCTNLNYLDLSDNLFSGQFPWKSLQYLTNLTNLGLGDNPFEITPFPLEILNLEKLQNLYLSNSSIQGTIPEAIENLRSLQTLELSDNYLVGEIPETIRKLNNLQELELYNNELNGSFPVGFGDLVMLSQLDVSNNNLEGDLSELRSLTRLESLHLFENKFSGEVPVEFGAFKFIKQFSIYSNKFTGELPPRIGSWGNFEYIEVAHNSLTGSIPPDMCKKGKLTNILMLENNFTGGLPESYANCSSLLRLRVSNNSLSGRVPAGIWSLPNVNFIDLAMNQLEGELRPNIGEAKSLEKLFLDNNRFSGELPQEITEVSSLMELKLMSNRFTGEIPTRIGDLKELRYLRLEANLFSGTIPESLGSCVSILDINLAGNSISGQIPASLGSIHSLDSLNVSGNKLSGVIPASLSSLKLKFIDLSNNTLIGRVPEFSSVNVTSFAGNPGLCVDRRRDLRPCSLGSRKFGDLHGNLHVKRYCFIAGGLLLFLLLAYFLFVKLRRKYRKPSIGRGIWCDMKIFHNISINEGEILRSLNQENLIGRGGSANVYKVELGGGKKVAVKQMSKSGGETILPRRKNRWSGYDDEVAILSSIRHGNVVKLYCSITSEDSNLLVYEYMPNGSLWDQDVVEMDWEVRYMIAMGAAEGLEYLHHCCNPPVIHRDVKSSNILLDEEMKPKIADFGLAKIVQENNVMDSTEVIAGTYGYIAPECGYTLNVTEKSDIYSFGVVLMELVTGKKPIRSEFGENKDLVCWIHEEMRSDDTVITLVDPTIAEDCKEEAVEMLMIAVRCTEKIPALRPSMKKVVETLKRIKPRPP